MELSNATLFLWRAYYDDRVPESPVIRIVGVGRGWNKKRKPPTAFCQMWFEGGEGKQKASGTQAGTLQNPDPGLTIHVILQVQMEFSTVTDVYRHNLAGLKKLSPFIFTCQVPDKVKDRVPSVVSVTLRACSKAINALKVFKEGLGEKK